MIPKPEFDKALDSVCRTKHELHEIYLAIGTMAGSLSREIPIEKAEQDALFQAGDAVRRAQAQLAVVAEKLLTAVTVEAVAKA